MRLVKHALLVYAFASSMPEPDEVRRWFGALWDVCLRPADSGGFGIDRPLPVSDPLSDDDSDGPMCKIQKAAERSNTGMAYYQAFELQYHDVEGLIVYLAPNEGPGGGGVWQEQRQDWDRAAGTVRQPGYFRFTAYVFYALYSGYATAANVADAARRALQGSGWVAWRRAPARLAGTGIFVGECRRTGGSDAQRAFVFIAPAKQDLGATALLVPDPSGRLPSFVGCLIDAEKINYEWSVYRNRMAEQRHGAEGVDRALSAVLCLHHKIESRARQDSAALIESQSGLSGLLAGTTGLLIVLSRLKDLQSTVEIAADNLRASCVAGDPGGGSEGAGLFDPELQRAQDLRRQIPRDIGYLETTRERAREVHAMIALRLEETRAKLHRQVEVMQAVLLGALLVSLDAMHAFQTHLPLPQRLHWPLILTLMALVFTLPLLILQWHEPYTRAVKVGALMFGAMLGWLIIALWWEIEHQTAPPLLLTVGCSLEGAALLWLSIHVLDHAQGQWSHWLRPFRKRWSRRIKARRITDESPAA